MTNDEILKYICTPAFAGHVCKIKSMFKGEPIFIDDATNDFFVYYAENRNLNCNIRKLYGIVIDQLRKEARYRELLDIKINDPGYLID